MPTDDEPIVYCRHLIVCRSIWYDSNNPDQGYSLGRLVVNVQTGDVSGGPFLIGQLFVFTQLFGTVGDYDVWIKLMRVGRDENGDEALEEIADGGPSLSPITGLDLVESHAYALDDVPFSAPGLYEFQLWVADFEDVIGWERVEYRSAVRERDV